MRRVSERSESEVEREQDHSRVCAREGTRLGSSSGGCAVVVDKKLGRRGVDERETGRENPDEPSKN